MKQYKDLLKYVLENGELSTNRTGIDALSVFSMNMKFDLSQGFPALTTKKIHFKSFIHELLWFIAGRTDVKYLQDHGVRIWNEWTNSDGELVSCYGKQWRKWNGINFDDENICQDGNKRYGIREIDQLNYVINEIKTNPTSRRLIINAWNPNEIDIASLLWCHAQVQFKVTKQNENGRAKLNCHLLQRSGDIFLGVPANIFSYSLLTHMIAQICNMDVGSFSHTIVDAHLYINHIEQAKEQLSREPYNLPTLWLNPEIKNINDFTYEDIKILNYESHPAIKAVVAV